MKINNCTGHNSTNSVSGDANFPLAEINCVHGDNHLKQALDVAYELLLIARQVQFYLQSKYGDAKNSDLNLANFIQLGQLRWSMSDSASEKPVRDQIEGLAAFVSDLDVYLNSVGSEERLTANCSLPALLAIRNQTIIAPDLCKELKTQLEQLRLLKNILETNLDSYVSMEILQQLTLFGEAVSQANFRINHCGACVALLPNNLPTALPCVWPERPKKGVINLYEDCMKIVYPATSDTYAPVRIIPGIPGLVFIESCNCFKQLRLFKWFDVDIDPDSGVMSRSYCGVPLPYGVIRLSLANDECNFKFIDS